MADWTVTQEALSYGFGVEWHVPTDYLLRSVDWFVRMLLIVRCMGTALNGGCEHVHLNWQSLSLGSGSEAIAQPFDVLEELWGPAFLLERKWCPVHYHDGHSNNWEYGPLG